MTFFTAERKNTLIKDLESMGKLLSNDIAKNKLEEIISQIREIDSTEDHEWYGELYQDLFRAIAELKQEHHDLRIKNLEMRTTNEKLSKRITSLEDKLKLFEIERKPEYHWSIVRSGLNLFIGTLFKTVHPEVEFNSKYSYHLKDIVNEFSA